MRLIDADKIVNYRCKGNMTMGNGEVGEKEFLLLPISSLSELPTVPIVEASNEIYQEIVKEIRKAEQNYYFNQCWNYQYLIDTINKLIDLSKKVEV